MVKLYVKTVKINIVAIATISYNGNGRITGRDRADKGAYKMKKITKERAEQIYQMVAVQHHTSVDNVKKEIKLAMIAGMCSQDPEIQKEWNEIPHENSRNTSVSNAFRSYYPSLRYLVSLELQLNFRSAQKNG